MRGESEQPPIDEIDEIKKKRAVLLSRVKDFLIKDFFEDDRGRYRENKKYDLISRHASKLIQAQGNFVKLEILQIEVRIQCQYCNAKAKPGETFRVCVEIYGEFVTKFKHEFENVCSAIFEHSTHHIV